MTSWQHWFNLSERALYFHKILFIHILFPSRVAKDFKLGSTLQLHESRLEIAVLNLPSILLIKMELYCGASRPYIIQKLFVGEKSMLRNLVTNCIAFDGICMVKGALSGLIQFLATESPLKMMKNTFAFTLKALFVLKIFKFLSWLLGHVEKV